MKDIMDPVHPGETAEKENYANRKLIRPTLMRSENHGNHNGSPMQSQERRERPERHERPDRGDRPMGGGIGKGNRHIVLPPKTEIGNLWLTVANRFGVPMEKFGDSTSTIDFF